MEVRDSDGEPLGISVSVGIPQKLQGCGGPSYRAPAVPWRRELLSI